MVFWKSKEKELKMIWEVEKNGKNSKLIGTAHFFPYSFKTSLAKCLKDANLAIFEGPLDKENMAKVRAAGRTSNNTPHLFDELDQQTIDRITEAIFPVCKCRNPFLFLNPHTLKSENFAYTMIEGMRPWMAFFTLWSTYLERNGWKYSVDYEGYTIAKELDRKILFLETIEEQIKVLETLNYERIVDFLKRVDHWIGYTRKYVKGYLEGDLDGIKYFSIGFPSRHYPGIKARDRILYERMRPHLEKGNAVVFVGAPHIWGISSMLRNDGFQSKDLP